MIKTEFDSLDEAIKRPNSCKVLRLTFVDKSFQNSGSSLVKLVNLRELFIQGDPSIYEDYEFNLPPDIGELVRLKKLSLLNLPIVSFPDWVFKLTNLEYLMIRGTDIKVIPEEIAIFSQLTTLRIENCPLLTVPGEISALGRLKNLGLSDTKLTAINDGSLPKSLRRISLVGTKASIKSDRLAELKLKPGHVR